MPDLRFQVEKIAPAPRAIAPQLSIYVRIENAGQEAIHSVLLRCQVQIESARRRYHRREQEKLRDLFDVPERWKDTLHPLLWTNASVTAPAFTGSTVIEVPAPCTFDFDIAITKYLSALEDGEAPVSVVFSGTVFHDAGCGAFQVQQVPWDREATFRLSAGVWRSLMDRYYPGTAWVRLQREAFDRLYRYKVENGIGSVEEAIDRLLPQVERAAR
jgi:hypothetical protein